MDTLDSNDIRSALHAAIRAYEPSRPIRFARLIPFKDEICNFRRRGASFEIIAILLKNHSIETSYVAVRKFYGQVVKQRIPSEGVVLAKNATPSGGSEVPTYGPSTRRVQANKRLQKTPAWKDAALVSLGLKTFKVRRFARGLGFAHCRWASLRWRTDWLFGNEGMNVECFRTAKDCHAIKFSNYVYFNGRYSTRSAISAGS